MIAAALFKSVSFCHRICRTTREAGHVFIEFALVLPIMLMLAGYSLRLANQLQAREIASVLSRELATAIFSNCADIAIQKVTGCKDVCLDEAKTKTAIQGCLTRIKTTFDKRWNGDASLSIKPIKPSNTTSGSTDPFTLEVYRYDIPSFAMDLVCTSPDKKTTLSKPSDSVPQQLPNGISATQMCQRNRVVRAQVSFKITLLTPPIPGLSNGEVDITDETIM